MTQLIDTDETAAAVAADRAVKAKHRALWALGDYATVAVELVGSLGPILVSHSGVSPGDRVLDVAAGSGNAAIPAARAGADVVASDLTPELLAAGRRTAEAAGVSLRWEEADAEALPYADSSYDVVLSCLGVMFAPRHQVCADELVRVCRPGGRIGLLSWTPEGFIGQLLATMKPYAPPPPPGASPPPLWGREEHVRDLFGYRVTELAARRQAVRVDRFATGGDFRDYFKARYGPTIAVYRFLGEDAAGVAELDQAMADLGDRHLAGGTAMEWEYLLLTARRA